MDKLGYTDTILMRINPMKYAIVLVVSFVLMGCASVSEKELLKHHIEQQDVLINKMAERVNQMQTVIDNQNRAVKNSSCKNFCF